MSVGNNEIWREFFEEFKDCPELWQVKSSKYKNKDLKNKAWVKLLKSYKKIESDATIAILKNKINNIRACYRRELRKQQQSEKSGAGADDIYVPALWYFDILNFLRDNEISVSGTSSIDSDIEEIEIPDMPPKKFCSTGKLSGLKKEEFLQTAVEHLKEIKSAKKNKDEADIYSESWAISFRKLTERQKIFAKKSIDEILILGQLNQLTLNNVVSTSSSPASSYTNSPFMFSGSSTPLSPPPNATVVSSQPRQIILTPSQAAALSNESNETYLSLQDLFADSQYS